MGKTIKILFIAFCSVVYIRFPILASDVVPKILQTIGADELSNIAIFEIIPKFKFLLASIPDSIWKEYEAKYDSNAIYNKIEKNFLDFFDEKQIDDYYKLAQNLMKDYSYTDIPPFEYFQSKMDSLNALLDTLLNSPLFPPSFNQKYSRNEREIIDSILNSLTAYLRIDTNDVVIKFRNHFVDSLLKRYFFSNQHRKDFNHFDTNNKNEDMDGLSKIDLNNLLKNWDKYFTIYSESVKIIFEYFDTYLRLFEELEKLFKNYLEEHSKTPPKKQQELEKKFQKKMKELERKNKELEKKIETRLKQLQKKRQSLLNENNIEFPNRTQQEKLKRLLEKHYKFINSLITMKKQIEIEIIEDLQKKNYIKVEVPQN